MHPPYVTKLEADSEVFSAIMIVRIFEDTQRYIRISWISEQAGTFWNMCPVFYSFLFVTDLLKSACLVLITRLYLKKRAK
jgi:hypothetical protein